MNIFIFSSIALLSISSLTAGVFTESRRQQSEALYKYLEEKHPTEASLNTVEQFFKNGASPTMLLDNNPINRDQFAMPIMHWLIALDYKTEIIEAFCKHGYNFKTEYFSGTTALQLAFIADNIPVAKVLIAHAQGDYFLHPDYKGLTPLDYALASETSEDDRAECLLLMLSKINSSDEKENPLIKQSMASAQHISSRLHDIFTQWLK